MSIPTTVQITVNDVTKSGANNRAKNAEIIANSLTPDALQIIANAAQRPGASQKIFDFKEILENL